MPIKKKASQRTSAVALRRAGSEVKVTQFISYREFLAELYKHLKATLDRYSYLQFSEDLGLSKTNVAHLIVVGKRRLTLKATRRVSEAIGLTGPYRGYFESLVGYNNAKDGVERDRWFRGMLENKQRTLGMALDQAQLKYFSEWYHPVIREMLITAGFSLTHEDLAAQLVPPVSVEQVRESLALLQQLGLIRYEADSGRYVASESIVTSGDEVVSLGLIGYHHQLLDLAKESISTVDEDQRDISSITLCLSPALLAKVKYEIQTFRKHLLFMADQEKEGDRIVQVNFQLFPVAVSRGGKA